MQQSSHSIRPRFSRRAFLRNIKSNRFSSAFEAFLYSAGSVSLLRSNLNKVGGVTLEKKQEEEYRCRFAEMKSRLRKDGLLSRSDTLTTKAINFLAGEEKGAKKYPKRMHEKKEGSTFVMVMFDIPEKKRGYRDWMRVALSSMGMEPVQRSVWMGKVTIAEDFLDAIREARLLDYVEIIEITKKGTIEKIVQKEKKSGK